MFQRNKTIKRWFCVMHSHKIYVVCSSNNMRDIQVENVYDGKVFTIDGIVAGMKNKLKNLNFQVSILGDNAFIDLIDSNDELVKAYSIISKNVMLTKEEF